jgi:hypothetical protein
MTPDQRLRRRATLWATLLFVALAPFALVWCKAPSDPSAPPAASTAPPAPSPSPPPSTASPPPSPPAGEPSSAVPEVPPASSASPEVPPAPPLPASPASVSRAPTAPTKGPLPTSCGALERAMDASFDDRACTTAADCAVAAKDCACSRALARRALPRFEALQATYRAKDCAHQGPPKPCASCPPPPTARCEAGRCGP